MRHTRLIMGMPITIEVLDASVIEEDIADIFAYFHSIDATFSTYKADSEISKINRGELPESAFSPSTQAILALSEQTRQETGGYFDITRNGHIDPSGIVKGWSILQAARILHAKGFHDFYIDAGGDIQVSGTNHGQPWRVGIRNPFNRCEMIKVLSVTDVGIATSGTAIRGQHIYNPHSPQQPITDIVSLTVIGPNIYEADRFATAAFAMGKKGIMFLNKLPGFAAYMIEASARATYTSNFERYVLHHAKAF